MHVKTLPKRRGGPRAGNIKNGEPERVGDYPRQTFTMLATTNARLSAIAILENRTRWRVLENCIDAYFDQMTAKDRRAVKAAVPGRAIRRSRARPL
jgi:hypothetical protein